MLKLFRLHKNEFLSEHHQDVKDCIKYENSMVNLYSDNSKDLIKLIHNIYKFNDDIKICLTNGSEDALWKLFCHYKSNYKQLCVPRFTWHYYTTLGKRFNYSIKEIDNKYIKDEKNYRLNYNEMEVDEPSIFILGIPGNPIGFLYEKEIIDDVISKNKDSLFILDIVYNPFEPNEMINLVNKYKNVYVVNSFSKYFGIPGQRLGFMVSKNNDINIFNNYLGINSYAIKLGSTLLKNKDHYKEIWNKYSEIIDMYNDKTYDNLQFFNSKSNFLVIKTNHVKNEENTSKIQHFAKNNNIEVKIDDMSDKLCVRITLSTDEKILKFIDNFINNLNSY